MSGEAMCDTLRQSHWTNCGNWGETVANQEKLATLFVPHLKMKIYLNSTNL